MLRVVFDYLTLLRSTPPQAWAAAESKKLGEIGWRWKENGQPAPLVKGLASRLTEGTYPPDKVLVGPWFAEEFDEARVKECLEGLVSERCRVFVGGKEPLEGREGWSEKEEYYGTEYEIRPLQVDVKEVSGLGRMSCWCRADPTRLEQPAPAVELALPGPNIFLPEDLELVTKTPVDEVHTKPNSRRWSHADVSCPPAQPLKRPFLVRQTSSSRLFYKKDDTWCVPRATAYFLLKS